MEPDNIIHQPVRLKIMSALKGSGAEPLEFTRLKAIVDATDGNLGSHLATLETAGYVSIEKDFIGKKPRTRVALSKAGRAAFDKHVVYLRAILDGVQ